MNDSYFIAILIAYVYRLISRSIIIDSDMIHPLGKIMVKEMGEDVFFVPTDGREVNLHMGIVA